MILEIDVRHVDLFTEHSLKFLFPRITTFGNGSLDDVLNGCQKTLFHYTLIKKATTNLLNKGK